MQSFGGNLRPFSLGPSTTDSYKRVTKYYEKEGCSIHWDVCTPPSNIFISCLMFITGVLGVLKVSVSIVLHFLDLVVAIAHLMIMMMMMVIEV